jgi:transcriptional regulator with XRE-family HTH domain
LSAQLLSIIVANDQSFGGHLRSARKARGMSQQELADRSGITVRSISNLECGRTRWPYRSSLQRLADALELIEPDRRDFLAMTNRRLAEMQLAMPEFAARQHPLAGLPHPINDTVTSSVLTATAHLYPGRGRLAIGTTAFLDAYHDDRVRSTLIPAGCANAEVHSETEKRKHQLTRWAANDFTAMGWASAVHVARLWLTMAAEVAAVEVSVDMPIPSLRTVLLQLTLRHWSAPRLDPA